MKKNTGNKVSLINKHPAERKSRVAAAPTSGISAAAKKNRIGATLPARAAKAVLRSSKKTNKSLLAEHAEKQQEQLRRKEQKKHERDLKIQAEQKQISAYLTDPLKLFSKNSAQTKNIVPKTLSASEAEPAERLTKFGSKIQHQMHEKKQIDSGSPAHVTVRAYDKAALPALDSSNDCRIKKGTGNKSIRLMEAERCRNTIHKIEMRDIYKYFGKKKAVDGISFNISSGEIVVLLGPNGAGKTTLFYMIAGFLKPTKGAILFDGADITKHPMYKRAQIGISYLPQNTSVFRGLSVENNIMAVLQTQHCTSKAERQKRLDYLLDEFGISALRKQKGYTLSGGECRKTEIARSMALNPKFLLLDEPFTGIDPKARHELKQIITALAKNNVGMIITDHNERDTLSISDYVLVADNGHIIASGSRDEIMRDDLVREVYLGKEYV